MSDKNLTNPNVETEQQNEVTNTETPVIAEIEDEEALTLADVDEQALGTLGVEFDADEGVVLIDDEETFTGLVDENGMFEIETKKKDAQGNKIKKKVKARRKHDYSIGIMKEENYGLCYRSSEI